MNAAIIEDITCIDCGYNLRGLDERGRCPECGQSVEPSVRWARDRRPDAKWAKWMAAGLGLMVFGGAAAMGAVPNDELFFGEPAAWQTAMLAAAVLISLGGLWLLAMRERTRDAGAMWRVGPAALATVISLPVLAELAMEHLPWPTPRLIEQLSNVSAWVAGAATLLYFERVRRIARRCELKRLAVWAAICAVGLCAAGCLALIIFEPRPREVIGLTPIPGAGMPGMILPIISVLGEEDVTDAWQFYCWLTQPVFLLMSWAVAIAMVVKLRKLAAPSLEKRSAIHVEQHVER